MRRKNRRQFVAETPHPQMDAALFRRTTDYSEIPEASATKAKVE
jgi:hypothetical protein